MSQRNVELLIGRLVTDEGFRRRFGADPRGELRRLLDEGVALNPCELRALATLDLARVARFAGTVHPCIQKVELAGTDPADVETDVENDDPASTHYRTGGGHPGPESRIPETEPSDHQPLDEPPPGEPP